jgi:hypothetical protein
MVVDVVEDASFLAKRFNAETKRLIIFFVVTYDIPKDKRSPK